MGKPFFKSLCTKVEYKILFIIGAGPAGSNFTELRIRRANTLFQLMNILEENHHIFLILEIDPMHYKDAAEMVEYLAQALKQTSRETTILLYSPGDRIPTCRRRRSCNL